MQAMTTSALIANLLFLLIGAIVSGFYFNRTAYPRGRREAELESASPREEAVRLKTQLDDTENDLKKSRQTLQDVLNEKSTLKEKVERIPILEEELKDLKNQAKSATTDLLNLNRDNATLQTELKELRDREPEMKEALQSGLLEVAGKFLEKKGEAFTKQNLLSIENLLNPLGTKLKDFETKVEATYQQERDQHTQLKTQIELLYQMNQNLGQEARNLTTALKGENKTGGNWGEVILERVLEFSGLEKDREYRLQVSMHNEEGQRKQPDAIIYLPNNRQLVIDSKLSLLAYERHCSATSVEEAQLEMDQHIQSIRQHIKNLSQQRYQDLPDLQTVDFVFLFMPIEPAFIEAVKRDQSLFQEAFGKNIIIVSPSTLLATLRTVASTWKQEYLKQNTQKISKQAGDLYDKFVGFLEDLQTIGKALATAQISFDAAKNKLIEGKGNLIGRVEQFKELKVKTKKDIPKLWKEALDEEPEEPDTQDNRLLD